MTTRNTRFSSIGKPVVELSNRARKSSQEAVRLKPCHALVQRFDLNIFGLLLPKSFEKIIGHVDSMVSRSSTQPTNDFTMRLEPTTAVLCSDELLFRHSTWKGPTCAETYLQPYRSRPLMNQRML